MPKTLMTVDFTKAPADQDIVPHNRWHPEVPPIAAVDPGEVFRLECHEWTGGQVGDNDSADDIRDLDLLQVHYLSGPIAVNGAEPGDLLVVDILDIGTLPEMEWGYTGIFDQKNGGGFLTEHFPDAHKAVYNFEGIFARSRHIPGVRFAGITHPGLIGVAPSQELLDRWNRREAELIASDPDRVPPLAHPPTAESALAGQAKGEVAERIIREGARTVPGRENGGNCDIKNLSRGARIYFPVFVPGANLSVGDLHFSQGDGEITFCGGIEMAGWIDLHVDVIKDGMNTYNIEQPVFMPGPVEPRYSEFIAFEGISVDDEGKQLYLDANTAYRRACLHAIEYFKSFGYTGEQTYLLLGGAPVEGRISGIVDIPNALCTLYIPTEIFDIDVRPSSKGPDRQDRGRAAATS